jgi:hypothetical protein
MLSGSLNVTIHKLDGLDSPCGKSGLKLLLHIKSIPFCSPKSSEEEHTGMKVSNIQSKSLAVEIWPLILLYI